MTRLRSLLKNLWFHISPRRRVQLGLLLVLIVLASFAEIVSIGSILPFLAVLMSPEDLFVNPLLQPIIVILGFNKPNQLLLPLTVIFVMAAMFSGAVRLVLLWVQTRLGFAIGADFSNQIYKRTLYQPYAVHVERNSSQIIAGIFSKTNTVIHSAVLPVLLVISSGLIFTTILIALVAINPILALTVLGGFGFVYALIAVVTKKRIIYDSQRINREEVKVVKTLQEGLGGIRDVLIDGSQEAYLKIYRDADVPLRKSQASIQVIGGAPRFIVEPLGITLIAILAFELAQREGGVGSAIPVLGVLAIGAQRLLPILQQLYGGWAGMRGGQAAMQDVLDLLDQPLPAYARSPAPVPMPFERSIHFNHVGFRYGDKGPWVLQDINFEIPKGSRVGFIGTTGSGKSTLLDILMGLLQPMCGALRIDDISVTIENQRAWQSHIVHVPQAIFLADSTVAENIAFGVPPNEIDYKRVRLAARKAQIAETIESWNAQYQTLVGERGVRISGGQRQRIGIARALYKDADVIVLDEATSALDNQTECAVMNAIAQMDQDVTIFMVAHRLTTLRGCDFIVELDQGRLKRLGKYQEIVSKSEHF